MKQAYFPILINTLPGYPHYYPHWFLNPTRVPTENLKQNSLTFPWIFMKIPWRVESKFNK